MRTLFANVASIALALFVAVNALAQEPEMPQPSPEHKHFEKEVGQWDVEIKAWMGPGDPEVTKGKESNRMMGGFWLISNFEGNMFGSDFQGHGVYGYDSEKKQYVGQWYDSLGSAPMAMTGAYDEKTKTMTYEGEAMGMDGKPAKHILATKFDDDGSRTMTMHMKSGEEMTKMFEMKMTKSADNR